MAGKMYATGDGGERDYIKARYFLKKAADSGIREARALLGYLYSEGKGGERNMGIACSLLETAIDPRLPDVNQKYEDICVSGR